MATTPRRAVARPLVDDFTNPHSWSKRSRKARGRPKRITEQVTIEALDVLEALAQCFVPVGATDSGDLFLCVMPTGLLDRLAALGADLAEMEPSLGSGEGSGQSFNQDRWGLGAGLVVDGEPDAGEEPEWDPAEAGIADRDALADYEAEAAAAAALFHRGRGVAPRHLRQWQGALPAGAIRIEGVIDTAIPVLGPALLLKPTEV